MAQYGMKITVHVERYLSLGFNDDDSCASATWPNPKPRGPLDIARTAFGCLRMICADTDPVLSPTKSALGDGLERVR